MDSGMANAVADGIALFLFRWIVGIVIVLIGGFVLSVVGITLYTLLKGLFSTVKRFFVQIVDRVTGMDRAAEKPTSFHAYMGL